MYVYLPEGADNRVDASTPYESNALISQMKERIGFLEEELRRKDAILINMTEATKAITPPTEASQEPRESDVSAAEGRGGDHVIPGAGEACFVVA